ncbi:D-inositol-3-phosphate glycosyltransferase [Candidatus Methanobinarius endosymbioticus]|uniref:D-inositol-3-phosphate glycosyltransferase n=1 Tax=Candidatus Methanobinarius endosymbioticus TaxID=2006182 RepID=A0A366M9R1_9EURY|nr:D-inositol-3-phosphate glycosyltransferase [Candidatus Methanobinarius endosymbioticus]
MKILHIVPIYYPCLEAGGIVNAVYQLGKKQAEKGNDVIVFTTDSCSERIKLNNRYDVDVEGVKVYYFKNLSNILKTKFIIDTPYALPFKMRKEIKKYDIVHIHEHRHSLAVAASHYAKKNNIPYVLQAHGSVLPFFQKKRLKEIFDKIWGFKILKNTSKLFALTKIEKNQYIKMGVDENKIEIVPLGIELEEYSNLAPKGNFRKKYNIKDDEQLLLFIGRINKIKGLDLLVNSFNILNKTNPNVKLAIVGPDNGFLDELKSLIKKLNLDNKIIIPGPLFEDSKKEAIIDSDIFVMPSQYESFTTSGLEAMACEKPVVLTKNNHIHTWVNNKTGLSAEYNAEDLSNKIKHLLDDKELSETMGSNGLKQVKKFYNWDSVEDQIMSIYKNII